MRTKTILIAILMCLFLFSNSSFAFTINNEIDLDAIAKQAQENSSSYNSSELGKYKEETLFEKNNTADVSSQNYSQDSFDNYMPSKDNTNARVAVFLPLSGSLSQIGAEIKQGITQYFNEASNSFLYEGNFIYYDVNDSSSLRVAFNEAVSENVDIILGPLQKNLIKQLSDLNKSIPVIAFNKIDYGTALVNPLMLQANFFVENKINSLYRKLLEMNKNNVIIVYPDNDNKWETLSYNLKDKLIASNINIDIISSYNSNYNQLKTSIKNILGHKIYNIEKRREKIKKLQDQGINPITTGYSLKGDIDAIVYISDKRNFGMVSAVFNYYYADEIDKFAIISDGFGVPPEQGVDVLSDHLYLCENRNGLSKLSQDKVTQTEYKKIMSSNYLTDKNKEEKKIPVENSIDKTKKVITQRTESNRIFYLLGYNMAMIVNKKGYQRLNEGFNLPLADGSNIIFSFPNIIEYQVPCFKPIKNLEK